MSTMFHRIKRLTLILAGTAALSGTFVPLAMADIPTGGSDNTPAGDKTCQNNQDWYNQALQGAANAAVQVIFGNGAAYQTMLDDLGQAAREKQQSTERGCDTSTWASTVSAGTPVAVNRTSVGSVSVAGQ
jgi:hypothetical protein